MRQTPGQPNIHHRGAAGLLLCILLGAIGAVSLVPGRALAQEKKSWKARFEAAYAKAREAEESKNWEAAVAAYTRVLELVPHEITTLFARARANARLGRTASALSDLTEAVENGWNDVDPLLQNEEFAELRDDPRFKAIVDEARKADAERLAIYVPSNVDCKQPRPLIVAFHGRGENQRYFLNTWKTAAERMGAIVVAPRGIRRGGNKLTNVWEQPRAGKGNDIDLAACKKLTAEAIAAARAKYKIDEKQIVLAGYSQGGAVALALLADDPARYAGAFVAASLYKSPGLDAWQRAQKQHGVRVYLLCGEDDPLTPHSREAADEIRKAGGLAFLAVEPGVGHEPPENYEDKQFEGVRIVLNQTID